MVLLQPNKCNKRHLIARRDLTITEKKGFDYYGGGEFQCFVQSHQMARDVMSHDYWLPIGNLLLLFYCLLKNNQPSVKIFKIHEGA